MIGASTFHDPAGLFRCGTRRFRTKGTDIMNVLYDIPDDLMPMQDLLRSTGGDLSDPDDAAVIDEYLDEGEQALEDKLESYCRLIREFEVRSAAKRLEADRLRTRSTIDSNAARSLKDRLQDFLERQERTEVRTPGFDISVQKNGGLQRIDFIGEVPQEFRKPGEPDRSRIRRILQSDEGAGLTFARLLPRETTIRIR